jgi:hypothetical protein
MGQGNRAPVASMRWMESLRANMDSLYGSFQFQFTAFSD